MKSLIMSISFLVLFTTSINAQRYYNYFVPVDVNENYSFKFTDYDDSYFEGSVYYYQIYKNGLDTEVVPLYVTFENGDQGTSSFIRRRFDPSYLVGYRINVDQYSRSVNNTYFYAKGSLSRGQHERYIDGTFYSIYEAFEVIMKNYINENMVETDI